jgi:hypothetical protein
MTKKLDNGVVSHKGIDAPSHQKYGIKILEGIQNLQVLEVQ